MRDYGRKPYVNDNRYPEFIRTHSSKAIWDRVTESFPNLKEFNKNRSRLSSQERRIVRYIKQSELKKPYDDESYEAMESEWEGLPGVLPPENTLSPDQPWNLQTPQDFTEGIVSVFDLESDSVWCFDAINEIVLTGNHPIYSVQITLQDDPDTVLIPTSGYGTTKVTALLIVGDSEAGPITIEASMTTHDGVIGDSNVNIPEGRASECPSIEYWYGTAAGPTTIIANYPNRVDASLLNVDSSSIDASFDLFGMGVSTCTVGDGVDFSDNWFVSSIYDNITDVWPTANYDSQASQRNIIEPADFAGGTDPGDTRAVICASVTDNNDAQMNSGAKRMNLGGTIPSGERYDVTHTYMKGFLYKLNSGDQLSRVSSSGFLTHSIWHTYHTLTFIPPVDDDYLVLLFSSMHCNIGTNIVEYVYARLLEDSTVVQGTSIIKAQYQGAGSADFDGYLTFCIGGVRTLTGGAEYDFNFQAKFGPTVGLSGVFYSSATGIIAIPLWGKQSYGIYSTTGGGAGTSSYQLTDAHPAGKYLILAWANVKPDGSGEPLTVEFKQNGTIVQDHIHTLPTDARWSSGNGWNVAQTFWVEDIVAGSFNHSIDVTAGASGFSCQSLKIMAIKIAG